MTMKPWDNWWVSLMFLHLLSELLEDEGAGYTSIPKCTRSHILYNHTLLGGLRAGNFTQIAEVDSIETCAALCCAEQTCDLALVLGENCYAGDCASKELCVPVPVNPTAKRSSQIAYITSRKKVEEPGTGQWKVQQEHFISTKVQTQGIELVVI